MEERAKRETDASGRRVYVLGEKVITVKSASGLIKKMKFLIADVTRILASIGKITKAGNEVKMKKDGGEIIDRGGGSIEMELENGVYVIRCWAKKDGQQPQQASGFPRRAR